MALIEVSSLSYTYMKSTPYETRALRNVSLSVERGEVLAIIGSTGCGKSTLVRHLNGIIRPESGRVVVDGMNVSDRSLNLRDLRRRIGLVFQYPEYQLFEETVAADIAFAPRQFGFSEEETKKAVASAMDAMGLDRSMASRSPFSLSGGEMRRVAIAGVIAIRPSILVLDEPSAGLDPASAESLMELILSLNRRDGVTVIMVSHSMDEAVRTASRIAVMHEGSVIASGNPSEVFSSGEVISKARLLLPQCTELMVCLGERGVPVRTNVYDMEECAREIASVLGAPERPSKKSGGKRL